MPKSRWNIASRVLLAIGFVAVLHASSYAQKQAFLTHEDAVIAMSSDPDSAEAMLERASSPSERLDFALFLHAFRDPTPERNATIRALLSDVETAVKAKGDYWGAGEIGTLVVYDGSDKSLIPIIRAASVSDISGHSYVIPCGVLERRSALIEATYPLYAGNGDNFLPRSGCQWGRGTVHGFPQAEIDDYLSATENAAPPNTIVGSIRFSYYAIQNATIAKLQTNPHSFVGQPHPRQQFPYQTWSYLSLANHAAAERIRDRFLRARTALSNFYMTRGLSRQDGNDAATNALFAISFGGQCGQESPEPSLRVLLMDGASLNDIRDFIRSGAWRDAKRLAPILTCAQYGDIDPLIHVAIKNPAVVPLLQELAALVPSDIASLDLDLDVNAPNTFGKTPLMTAAQFNLLEGARYLVEHGADVNRTTDDQSLANSHRTAAASGSLPLIRYLVQRGANIAVVDVRGTSLFPSDKTLPPAGLRPIDYLEGRGPVPANPLLSPSERVEASKILSRLPP